MPRARNQGRATQRYRSEWDPGLRHISILARHPQQKARDFAGFLSLHRTSCVRAMRCHQGLETIALMRHARQTLENYPQICPQAACAAPLLSAGQLPESNFAFCA